MRQRGVESTLVAATGNSVPPCVASTPCDVCIVARCLLADSGRATARLPLKSLSGLSVPGFPELRLGAAHPHPARRYKAARNILYYKIQSGACTCRIISKCDSEVSNLLSL